MKYRYDIFSPNEFETHMLAFKLIESNKKILDIGCATGYMAKSLLAKKCETYGVDYDQNALKKAEKYCKKTFRADLNEVKTLPFPKKTFDYVLLMDVIEHLTNSDNILSLLKQYLKKDGKLIISVPNIAHASIRWSLMTGKFDYTSTGILDQTHVHFYTQKSFEQKLKDAGFEIEKLVPTNGMCKVPLLYKITDRLPVVWQYKIACMNPALFGFQFVALARVS